MRRSVLALYHEEEPGIIPIIPTEAERTARIDADGVPLTNQRFIDAEILVSGVEPCLNCYGAGDIKITTVGNNDFVIHSVESKRALCDTWCGSITVVIGAIFHIGRRRRSRRQVQRRIRINQSLERRKNRPRRIRTIQIRLRHRVAEVDTLNRNRVNVANRIRPVHLINMHARNLCRRRIRHRLSRNRMALNLAIINLDRRRKRRIPRARHYDLVTTRPRRRSIERRINAVRRQLKLAAIAVGRSHQARRVIN